jgi:hypothetical protein
MSKLFYAFHYESGLHTTYANNPSKTAGFVRAYATKSLRDEACNDYASSFFDFNKKVLPVRSVTVKEIRAMGHGAALDDSTDEGAAVKAYVVGVDIDHSCSFIEFDLLNPENCEYDLEQGFFWVEYGSSRVLQCCLSARKDESGYVKAITRNDSGFDWGLCADANGELVELFGSDACFDLLLSFARREGIKII